MFTGFCNKDVSIYSKSPWFYNATAVGTASVAVTFPVARNVLVELVDFTTGSGTVTLWGSIQEDLVFVGNGRLISNNQLTKVDSVSTIGLTNEASVGKLKLGYCSESGHPIEDFSLVGTQKAWVSSRRMLYNVKEQGMVSFNGLSVMMKDLITVNMGDYIKIDSNKYPIASVNTIRDRMGSTHHLELIVNTEKAEV